MSLPPLEGAIVFLARMWERVSGLSHKYYVNGIQKTFGSTSYYIQFVIIAEE